MEIRWKFKTLFFREILNSHEILLNDDVTEY